MNEKLLLKVGSLFAYLPWKIKGHVCKVRFDDRVDRVETWIRAIGSLAEDAPAGFRGKDTVG